MSLTLFVTTLFCPCDLDNLAEVFIQVRLAHRSKTGSEEV
jgi:hypothetical protein